MQYEAAPKPRTFVRGFLVLFRNHDIVVKDSFWGEFFMTIIGFMLMSLVMIAAGWLIHDIYDFKDRLTKAPLHPYIRMMSIFGGVLLFIGFNGGTALSLMTGLILCILSEIVLLKRR
jgi:hypothetical protein